jgi:lipopolysaccharide transport system ATP-binding protein
MSIAIHVENLSKCYSIAHQRAKRDESLRVMLERGVRSIGARIFGRNDSQALLLPDEPSETHEDFYALNDVSFEVKAGERVGIIGANGAGKSTLLKILSRITEPTSGRITIRGRVSSLLEVGTGFHPELTGRENIYLNGAILGMPRSEIRRKFDEIVEFSEVERFLDTPVKHYSSGMYVRLAFSVSAHLDPEVLILDEVLAVGDARFQKKCLSKMQRFSDEGRTVLFVSHSSHAISQFCSSAIYLEQGRIRRMGPAQEVVEEYMKRSLTELEGSQPTLKAMFFPEQPVGDEFAQITSVELFADGVNPTPVVTMGQTIRVRIAFMVPSATDSILVPNLHVRTQDGAYVCVVMPPNNQTKNLSSGNYVAECVIPAQFLNNGVFTVQAVISSYTYGSAVHANVPDALVFQVSDDLSDISYRNGYMQEIGGVVRPRFHWRIGEAKN